MKRSLLLSLFVASIISCFAWGQKGHDVTCYIAEKHLTDKTKHAVDSIFDGRSMVYWGNWLDNASHQPEYAYTSKWHYKNIDKGQDYYEVEVPEGGNIIVALTDQINALANGNLNPEDATLALKVLVHLMGDLHQPMHMGRLVDRGGNGVKVLFFNNNNNLHSIWDSSILESGHKWSYSEWQDQLDRLSLEEELTIIDGTLDDWGYETHKIAERVYDETPTLADDTTTQKNLSYDYVAAWTPVIENQLLKGGLRLAHVLNLIFDPGYAKIFNLNMQLPVEIDAVNAPI